MTLKTMEPNPAWDAASYEDTVDILGAYRDEVRYKIWCGDWCKDCRGLLPTFSAALEAADIPKSHIEQLPVDQDKQGPGVDAYGVEKIPTIVIERVDDGTELTRFVESEALPPAVWLAEQLDDILGDA